MEQYYILRNGNRFGPYSPDQLQAYVATGQILLYDVAYSMLTGDRTTVKDVLAYNRLKVTLPTEETSSPNSRKLAISSSSHTRRSSTSNGSATSDS